MHCVSCFCLLSRQLTGHKNSHFPIRSSFYAGPAFGVSRPAPSRPLVRFADDDASASVLSADDRLLLATGSADSRVYVFDLTASSNSSAVPERVLRLEGHKDRVYAVQFHPSQPLLASCSADGSIKVWG